MNALLLSFLFVSLCGISNALHIPVVARSVDHAKPRHMMMKGYQSHHKGLKVDENIENAKDIVYATNITVGGQTFPIQLDSGSSDLWIKRDGLNVTSTSNLTASLTFGIGEVSGNISFAEMEIGPHTIPSQAFLNADNATNFDTILNRGILGIMGLAFDSASTIFQTTALTFGLNDTRGVTPLTNVFLQNRTAPTIFTVLLGRSYDKDGPEEGAFTISETVKGLEAIDDQPQLPRTPAQLTNVTVLPRWSVVVDSMTVNGTQFKFNQSSVDGVDGGKQVAVLDTGFTFPQIPAAAVDAIYSNIPGAVFNATSGLFNLPCDFPVSMSFELGGKTVPIHPLDITTVSTDGDQTVCHNAYRAISLPPGVAAGFDMILGDGFLKNAYAKFDFNFANPDQPPFVQLLATTEPKSALKEFQTVRPKQIKKNDKSIADAKNSTSSSSSSSSTSTSSSASSSSTQESSTMTRTAENMMATMSADKNCTDTSKKSSTDSKMMSSSSDSKMMSSNSDSMMMSGSLAVEQPLGKRASMGRIVIFRGGVVPGQPMRFHQKVMNCMNRVANDLHEAYGPVALTLLAGTLGIAVLSCIMAVALGIRMLLRRRRGEEKYEPLAMKEEMIFDAQEEGAAISYNHHEHPTTTPGYRSD
ncbi:acid protease [Trametopsis cervina]|nr:acid protease [Trametopsis cervina]